jgi:hypothetical protein
MRSILKLPKVFGGARREVRAQSHEFHPDVLDQVTVEGGFRMPPPRVTDQLLPSRIPVPAIHHVIAGSIMPEAAAWDRAPLDTLESMARDAHRKMSTIEGVPGASLDVRDDLPNGRTSTYDRANQTLVLSRQFLTNPDTSFADLAAVLRAGTRLERQSREVSRGHINPMQAHAERDAIRLDATQLGEAQAGREQLFRIATQDRRLRPRGRGVAEPGQNRGFHPEVLDAVTVHGLLHLPYEGVGPDTRYDGLDEAQKARAIDVSLRDERAIWEFAQAGKPTEDLVRAVHKITARYDGVPDQRMDFSDKVPPGMVAEFDRGSGTYLVSSSFINDPNTSFADVVAVVRAGTMTSRGRLDALAHENMRLAAGGYATEPPTYRQRMSEPPSTTVTPLVGQTAANQGKLVAERHIEASGLESGRAESRALGV